MEILLTFGHLTELAVLDTGSVVSGSIVHNKEEYKIAWKF